MANGKRQLMQLRLREHPYGTLVEQTRLCKPAVRVRRVPTTTSSITPRDLPQRARLNKRPDCSRWLKASPPQLFRPSGSTATSWASLTTYDSVLCHAETVSGLRVPVRD